MTDKERRNVSITAVVFIIVALLPLVDNGYWLSIGTSVAMFTVLATSWALFSGPTNYISLATAAFFGVGMYVVAAGIDVLPYPMLVILAGLAGAVLAFVVGLATLRISGVYFVIFTLGLAELIRQVMTWGQSTMGKAAGRYVLTDATEPRRYWSLVALAALVFLTGWWSGRSRWGCWARPTWARCAVPAVTPSPLVPALRCALLPAVHAAQRAGRAEGLHRDIESADDEARDAGGPDGGQRAAGTAPRPHAASAPHTLSSRRLGRHSSTRQASCTRPRCAGGAR